MDDQRLCPGTVVELVAPLYGYDAGTRGNVVSVGSNAVLVQFESTGHAMFVAREALAVRR